MAKEINNNGYKYVDLELPSGTLWAEKNVGAVKPFEYGLYFQWGDTQGYTKDYIQMNHKTKNFSWNDYQFSINGSNTNFSKYTTNGAKLDLEDDAAHVNMGGDWHMPTPNQIKELLDNTISAWGTGVNGMIFTSKKNQSKFIFIPAIGGVCEDTIFSINSGGYVWSSMLSTDNICNGQHLYLNLEDIGLYESGRCYGACVRGVIG